MKKYFVYIILGCLVTSPAYAYLDGGTGSVIVQGLIAGIAGFLAMLKLYWEKLKTSFNKIFKRSQHQSVTNAEQCSHDD